MTTTVVPICSENHISHVEFYLMIWIMFVHVVVGGVVGVDGGVDGVDGVDGGVDGGVFQKKLLRQDHYSLSASFHDEYQML